MHSLLAQASAVGQIACGLAVAAVARLADLPQALAACTALLTIAIVLVRRLGTPRAARVS